MKLPYDKAKSRCDATDLKLFNKYKKTSKIFPLFKTWLIWQSPTERKETSPVARTSNNSVTLTKLPIILMYFLESNRDPFLSVGLYFYRSSMDGCLELFEPAPRMTSKINISSKLDPAWVYLTAQVLHRGEISLVFIVF